MTVHSPTHVHLQRICLTTVATTALVLTGFAPVEAAPAVPACGPAPKVATNDVDTGAWLAGQKEDWAQSHVGSSGSSGVATGTAVGVPVRRSQ